MDNDIKKTNLSSVRRLLGPHGAKVSGRIIICSLTLVYAKRLFPDSNSWSKSHQDTTLPLCQDWENNQQKKRMEPRIAFGMINGFWLKINNNFLWVSRSWWYVRITYTGGNDCLIQNWVIQIKTAECILEEEGPV